MNRWKWEGNFTGNTVNKDGMKQRELCLASLSDQQHFLHRSQVGVLYYYKTTLYNFRFKMDNMRR
uniref:Bm13438 n=1 Tax=Brugia malayi TaxID=6279 RepID=A0A1I9G1Q1_BRUMA|nr:Bm13438 [Brugia malayi]